MKRYIMSLGLIVIVLVFALSPKMRLLNRGYEEVYQTDNVTVYFDNNNVYATAVETLETPTGRVFTFPKIITTHYEVVIGLKTFGLDEVIVNGYMTDLEIEILIDTII